VENRKLLALAAIGLVWSLLYLYGVYSYQTLSEASPLHALAPWGLMVTGYVFFAFSSGGVFDSLAARIVLLGQKEEVRDAKRLMWLALALLAPGVATVFADLLHISHSLWIYLGFNPEARIAWNGVLYLLYGAFLLAALLYAIIRGEEALFTMTGKALLLAGMLASLTLEYNLAMAFGVNVAVPGWFAAPMGILGVATAFLLGAAWTTIGTAIEGSEETAKAASRELTLAAAATGFLALWVIIQDYSWGLSAEAARMMTSGPLTGAFAAAALLGILAPLLAGYPVRNNRAARLAVAALTVIGGFLLLHTIAAAGQAARIETLAPYHELAIHSLGTGYQDEIIHELLASPPELATVLGEPGVYLLLDALGLLLLALRPGEKPTKLLVFR
jgi:hypothetical protein